MRLMPRHNSAVKVTVPASSANLGPGFDTLGMALPLYLTVELGWLSEGNNYCSSHKGLIGSIIKDVAVQAGIDDNFYCQVQSQIPIARGLGSSAAATIAALLAINELAGLGMDEQTVLNRAAAIEGHADNIVPALVGGLTTVLVTEDKVLYQRLLPPDYLNLLVAVPDQELTTKGSRAILPTTIKLEDAVYNLQRTSYLVAALANHDRKGLKEAFRDRWHQPYRETLVPGLKELTTVLSPQPQVLGVTLSGSGSAVMVLVDGNPTLIYREIEQTLAATGWQGTIYQWLPCNQGAKIERGNNGSWEL